MMVSNFWNQVLSSKDTTSSKRLVTLIISLHFIIASFTILFIAFYVIFYTTKGKVDADLLGMLKDVLEYDFYIILSGLGFITADNLSQMMLERAKQKNSIIGAALQNQPSHVVVTPPVVAPPNSVVTPPSVTPVPTEDPVIVTPPEEDGPPIEIFESNKPE